MHTRSHGSFSTILVVIPLITVPLLAVFGIPQFAPVVASPLSEVDNEFTEDVLRTSTTASPSGTVDASDLFAPIDSDGLVEDRSGVRGRFDDGDVADWNDPFQQIEQVESSSQLSDPSKNGLRKLRRPSGELPANALSGWERDSSSSHDSFASGNSDFIVDSSQLQQNQTKNIVPFSRKYQPSKQRTNSDQQKVASDRTSQNKEYRFPVSQSNSGQRNSLTWRSAVDELNQLGIRQFRLQPGEQPGEFHFTCFFTPRDNPRITHRFEAEATEPLRAVQKVLDQIHEWLQSR